MMDKKRICIDCGSIARPAPHPGPRCATDHRRVTKERRLARRTARTVRVYGISGPEKEAIIDFQGGGCICMEWTGYNGNSRSLSVDHNHQTGVVRGALCKHCNDLLGRVRDDPRFFERMIRYLQNPPAVRLLGERIVPDHG